MYKKATRKGFLRVPRASTLVKKRWQILNTIKPNLIVRRGIVFGGIGFLRRMQYAPTFQNF